jgi:uncharacterized membrane protein
MRASEGTTKHETTRKNRKMENSENLKKPLFSMVFFVFAVFLEDFKGLSKAFKRPKAF